MPCSGSHLGITINIQNTKFVKNLPMIDAQFRFNQKPNCTGMIIGRSSKKFLFHMPIRNPRWLPPQVISLTQDHMGKIQKYILL
jgi:hypothetical protein